MKETNTQPRLRYVHLPLKELIKIYIASTGTTGNEPGGSKLISQMDQESIPSLR